MRTLVTATPWQAQDTNPAMKSLSTPVAKSEMEARAQCNRKMLHKEPREQTSDWKTKAVCIGAGVGRRAFHIGATRRPPSASHSAACRGKMIGATSSSLSFRSGVPFEKVGVDPFIKTILPDPLFDLLVIAIFPESIAANHDWHIVDEDFIGISIAIGLPQLNWRNACLEKLFVGSDQPPVRLVEQHWPSTCRS